MAKVRFLNDSKALNLLDVRIGDTFLGADSGKIFRQTCDLVKNMTIKAATHDVTSLSVFI